MGLPEAYKVQMNWNSLSSWGLLAESGPRRCHARRGHARAGYIWMFQGLPKLVPAAGKLGPAASEVVSS